jgi:outer membrane immunogenic protein
MGLGFGGRIRRLQRAAAILSLLLLLTMPLAAQAADIPRPVLKARGPSFAPYNWTGLYAGINFGAAFNTSNWVVNSATIKARGAIVGGTAGYNFQSGWLVWGLEGDLGWTGTDGTVACGAFVCETTNPLLGTIRGRAGRAFDRWLPYITAGAAFGRVKTTSTDPADPGGSKTRVGWSAGVGVEYAFTANWSAKVEYLYMCLGDVGGGSVCRTSVAPDNISIKESVIRAGINYKFSGPAF